MTLASPMFITPVTLVDFPKKRGGGGVSVRESVGVWGDGVECNRKRIKV